MGIWDKLQDELNRAGRVAQDAIDEGRLRLEIFRVRQLADKSAQALGYAVYRAKKNGEELDAAAWDRLAATLREHEDEAARLETELARVRAEVKDAKSAPAAEPAAAGATPASAAGDVPPPAEPPAGTPPA